MVFVSELLIVRGFEIKERGKIGFRRLKGVAPIGDRRAEGPATSGHQKYRAVQIVTLVKIGKSKEGLSKSSLIETFPSELSKE